VFNFFICVYDLKLRHDCVCTSIVMKISILVYECVTLTINMFIVFNCRPCFFSGQRENSIILTARSLLSSDPNHNSIHSVPFVINSDNSTSFYTDETKDLNYLTNVRNARPDVRRELLYMYDQHTASIYRIKQFTTDLTAPILETIYTGASRGDLHIAVDYISGTVYWTEPSYRTVMLHSTSGGNSKTKTLIHDGLDIPLGIAVDPISK